MSIRKPIGKSVFDAALDRLIDIYQGGHRIVVSFSGGKDSGVCVEMCILAAKMTGRLPIEVIMRDEEIMFPGTFEYAERLANRPEIKFHWIYARQPVINIFNRQSPYFWVFDPLLPPDQWVRQPPAIAYEIPGKNIELMTVPERFPPAEGKNLYAIIGLRVTESQGRMYGLFSAKGWLNKPNRHGVINAHPIYDWGDGDVWKSIDDNSWDYNHAYDVLARLGIPKKQLRIAPPTMTVAGARLVGPAARAWPQWFERVANRLDGIRAVAKYGDRALKPLKRLNETWEECFRRTCIEDAPAWIGTRATEVMRVILSGHAHHSGKPLPDVAPCHVCYNNLGSWKGLALAMYNGDPFSMKYTGLSYVEPEFFRAGAGRWDGTPGFS